ncbi:MGMT family protein [Candidatus Woesearchaeota archaeon]|nr:MGMT family protein [Candidatus Woesearchaeota archaeon]
MPLKDSFDKPTFQHKVLALLLKIPQGKVTTYKEIAHALGTRAYRAVGRALHTNNKPDAFPCYKVVASDGLLGGYANGPEEKIRRLTKDGILVRKGQIIDFEECCFTFGRV